MLAAGEGFELRRVEFELEPGAGVAVGSFSEVTVERSSDGSGTSAVATASVDGRRVARLSSTLVGSQGS